MLRVLTILLLVVLFTLQPVYAFPFIDDSTQKVLRQTWDAQTLSDLANGVIAVPETTINDYLTQILPDYPSVREAHISIQPGNQIILDLNTRDSGHLLLKGTITRFIQNSEESSVSIAVGQRKLLSKPVASWFFAHISLGMLTKLFGNPLAAEQDNFTSRIDGNIVTINFRPYIEHSPLRTLSVYGTSPADLFSIDSVSTETGLIRLHTSYHGSPFSLQVLQQLIPNS